MERQRLENTNRRLTMCIKECEGTVPPKTLRQVYDQYKHLDKELSDPTLIEKEDFRQQILFDLWQAVRSNIDRIFILSKEALEWLQNGEQGISSNAIFTHLTGVKISGWNLAPPGYPEDLIRCRLLLNKVPEFQKRFHEMKSLSDEWATMVEHWDELCLMMNRESPMWSSFSSFTGTFPKTSKRMKELWK
jgi:hypothetical protein